MATLTPRISATLGLERQIVFIASVIIRGDHHRSPVARPEVHCETFEEADAALYNELIMTFQEGDVILYRGQQYTDVAAFRAGFGGLDEETVLTRSEL